MPPPSNLQQVRRRVHRGKYFKTLAHCRQILLHKRASPFSNTQCQCASAMSTLHASAHTRTRFTGSTKHTHTHPHPSVPSVRILNFNFVCTHLSVIAEQPHVTTVGATAASGVHDRTKSLSIATHSLYALTHTHILCVRVQIRCASEQQKRTVWPAQCNARPTPPPGAHTG